MSEYWERELDEPQAIPIYHCKCCGCDICIGDEAYKVGDHTYYCTDCCGLFEIEEPERDWDFEHKARLEAGDAYF